jgi:lipoprotein
MTAKMVFCSLCLLLLGATSCTKDQDIESTADPSPSTAVKAQETEDPDVTHIPSSQLRSLHASYSPHQAKGLPLDSQSAHTEALTTLSEQLLKILPSFADPKRGEFAAIVVSDDKGRQEVRIEEVTVYDPEKIGLLNLLFAIALMPKSDSDMLDTAQSTEAGAPSKMLFSCDGGAKDGSSVKVNFPKNDGDLMEAGKKIATFISECMAGEARDHVSKITLIYMPI